jgi:hypothetical protein
MLFTNITRMEVRARRQANFACETFFFDMWRARKKKEKKNRGAKGNTCRSWASINFAYERGSEGGEDEAATSREGGG